MESMEEECSSHSISLSVEPRATFECCLEGVGMGKEEGFKVKCKHICALYR